MMLALPPKTSRNGKADRGAAAARCGRYTHLTSCAMTPSGPATPAQPQPICLRLTWQYLVAFAALTILCGTSREAVHHFAGAAVCGGFESKTVNSFELAPGCDINPWSVWATVAGRSSP